MSLGRNFKLLFAGRDFAYDDIAEAVASPA